MRSRKQGGCEAGSSGAKLEGVVRNWKQYGCEAKSSEAVIFSFSASIKWILF
jgi:hypothetical protein